MKNLINYLSKKSLSLGNGSGMTRKRLGIDSGMTRFCLASLICLCMLTVGVGNAWGAENDTHDFVQSISKLLNNCNVPDDIEISDPGYPVKEVIITYSYNKSAPATANVTIDGNAWGSGFSMISSKTSASISDDAASGDIVISFTANASCSGTKKGTLSITNVCLVEGASGGSSCSECTYYVYNGTTWVSIGTTEFDDVVLAPPTLPDNNHGAGNGCWTTDKNVFTSCTYYASGDKFRYVPNPGGAAPTSVNKPGSGTCELYAVYAETNGCLSTTVTAVSCARIWEEPEPSTPSVSGSNVTLSWSSVTGASGYHLYVTDGDSYEFDGDVNSTSKTLSGLAAGTYSWTVAANSSDDDACDSNSADGDDFEIVGCTDISSSTVTGVSVTPSKVGGSATWTEVANATSYEVKVYAGTATSGVALFSAEPTSNSCTITELSASTQYTVVVKAKNSCSTSNQGTATWTTSALTLYHVDFVNQSGAAVATVTQTTEEGNVTLPSASPSAACAALGWTFAGWKDGSAQTETTSAPTLIAAGTYKPTANKTFYAVYTMTESGGGTPKTTLLSDDFSDITTGTNTSTTGQTSWDGGTLWTSLTNATGADGMVKLGGRNTTGSFTAKNALNVASGTTITIRLKVKGWSSVEGNIVVSADNGAFDAQSYSYTATMSSDETEEVSSSVVLSKANPTITVATSAKRAFVDEIEIYYGGGGSSTTYWNSNPSCSSEATVTYHNNGAKSGAAPTDANSPYTIGDNVTVLGTGTMVAPDGKEFKCWNTASDGTGTDYNIGAKFDIAGNMDFYPKWVNAPYTVTFDAEGGTCGTTSLTEASGGAGVVLPAATAPCSTAGWSFYGWATSASTSTTSAPTTVGTTGATYYPTSAITLHAIYVNSGTYNSNPVCHEVTIGSHSNGTVNVNSSTTSPQSVTQGATVNIAATPSGGYNFTTWTITKTTGGNDVTSTLLGANATTASTSFTMPDYDVTVSATFTAKVMYSITWNVNGSTYTTGGPSDEAESGTKWSALTLPTAPADNTLSACDRTKFVGWSTSQLFGDGNSAPSDLFKSTSDDNADSHTITGATTFYAVFAKGSGSETKWEQIHVTTGMSLGDFSEGKYMLVTPDGHAFNGTISSGKGGVTDNAFSWSAGEATSAPAGADTIVFAAVESGGNVVGYSMYSKSSSKYLYASKAGSGGLAFQTSAPSDYWTYYGSNWRYSKSFSGSYANLRTYSESTFNTYAASNNSDLYLAKLSQGSSNFTDYATQCCTLKPVTNLAVSSTTANSVTLTWTAPSPTTGIDHLELRNASTDAKIGSDIAVGTTTTSVSGLVECNTYSYKIVSVGAVCETPSDVVEATPYSGSKTVTFNYNGGTGTPASFTTSCGGTSTILPTPTRDGYTFLGWWTAADGGSKVGDAGANYDVATTTTIHAHWAQNFTVTYDLNDGAADPICSGGTYYVGQSVTVCSTTPTKTSSSFLGWKRLDTGATVAGGSTFTMPSNNVTIQAQWETVYFHIYYKEEDGTAIATDDVPQTAEATLRNQTPCVGYTFFGWSTSKITTETTTKPSGATFIGKGGASYTPTADITVYPVYARSEGATTVKDTLTVANTGVTTSYSPLTGIDKNSTPKTIHSNAVYAIGAYNSGGMQFTDGTSNDDQKKSSLITTTSGGSLQSIRARIPYACSTTRYLYTKGNTSDYTMQQRSSQGGTLAWTVTHSTKADTWYSHDFSEDGYTSFFMYCGGGATKVDSIIVTWGTGTYYYATHCETKENVTVTYNGNGGTVGCGSPADGAITSVTWDYKNSGADAPELASAQTICASATRSGGYILRDWTTSADGTGTHYTPGASITSLANDITLYAQWDRVYTVTFNDQGTTTPVTQATYGGTVAVPSATTPCSAEWAFVGWSETAIAPMSFLPSIEIASGTSTYTPTADKTLYAIYRKTSTSSAFVAGMSGAYKISNGSTVYAGACNNSKLPETNAAGAYVFYIKYTSADGGKYTIQQADGKYLKYAGESTSLALDDETPYYWTMTKNGDLWHVLGVGSGRYLQYSNETGFKAYNTSGYTDIAFVAAEGQYYYRTMSCEDEFDITFHDNGTTINWATGHPEASYKDLADATVISTFPTATFDGWTFLGWRTADYTESTTAPASSGIYGGSNGTSGNALTIASANVDLYPVFTRFEDNEPFDQINGGDYYIYYLSSTDDGYGAYKRVYAGEYADKKRYESTPLCSSATEFTFTKLENGKWTILDKNTGKYLYGTTGEEDKILQKDAATEWTIEVYSGNQFTATCSTNTYGKLKAYGDGTSARFMLYANSNDNEPGYHRVYLGSCTNRVFTTNPSTTPNIELHGQVKVTSTASKSIKAASMLTVSASNITTANLTVTSDNSAFKFSLTSNGTYTASVNIPVVSNKVGVTPIYVEYTPTATTDGIEEATITVSDGASPTPTTASTTAGDVQGRHVPAEFVIAAKWGDKWYALPANCTESTSSTTGVLIEVDNASDPTTATYAPSYTKWGLQTVRPSRKGEYGTRMVFTEQLTTATAEDQKALFNGSTTNIQVNAMYKNYMGDATEKYEWIPTTTDLKDYMLTSATTLGGDASARTVSLSNKGVFGTLLINKSYDGKVRILPATFVEPAEMQVVEWKANSVVVMYTGSGTKAITQLGDDDPSSAQSLSSAKIDHGVFELTTSTLTSAKNEPLNITIQNGSDAIVGRKSLVVPAIVSGSQVAPLGLEADEATLTDVVVLDGATLSAVADKYTFKNITVYPGGKLVIGSGKQLGMASLTLRGGSSWGAASYEYKYPQFVLNNTASGAFSNTAAVINYDYVTTKAQYYTFVLPYDANTKNIKYPVDIYGSVVSASNTGSFEFQYYDGSARAAGGTGWATLAEDPSTGATLVAGRGYTFLGMPKKVDAYDGTDDSHSTTRQTYGIHRIPMSVAAAAVQSGENNVDPGKSVPISVTLADKNNASGWVLVGNPYLSNVGNLDNSDIQVGQLVHTSTVPWDGKWEWDDTNPETGVRYVVIPNNSGTDYSSEMASDVTLPAFKNFFVQISNGSATSLVIPAGKRKEKALIRALLAESPEKDIRLAVDLVSAVRSDKVDLLINDNYSAEFDQDGDFTKMMNGSSLNIYGVYPDDKLSFIAVDKTTAAGSIAIGYQVPEGGDYTLQLSDREYVMADAVEALYVTDHEMSPEVTTNLLDGAYEFHVNNAETNDTRFTVSIKLKENQDTPTDIDIINGGGDLDGENPIKFIYQDKMYILRNGVLYDATGKRVKEINK